MSNPGSHEQLRRLMLQIIQDDPVNGRRVISEIAHNAIFGVVPTQENNDTAVGKESPYSAFSAGSSTTSFSIPIEGRAVHDTPPSAKGQPVKPILQSSSWKTGHRVHKVVATADAQPTIHAPTQNPLQDALIGTVEVSPPTSSTPAAFTSAKYLSDQSQESLSSGGLYLFIQLTRNSD